MKTSIKCCVHHCPNQYAEPGAAPVFQAFPFDMTSQGYVLLGEAELVYEVPDDFNPLQSEINGLEKQLDLLAEQYHKNAATIRDRISNLQCIEHSPAGEA